MIIMNLKEYFNPELRSTILHALVGAIIGYISFLINEPLINLGIAIIVIAVLYFLTKTVWKIQEKFKWWIGNGIIVFLLIWFAVWIIFYNLNLWNAI